MVRTGQSKSNVAIAQLVEGIIAAGTLSRQEHLLLTSALLSDRHLTDEDRRQINRIFDNIQIKRIAIVDQ